ncbi:hypothetical protein L7F22_005810 [Adiantum nelumboides]|nr:hypothetical protein [Adiantum nelumboides]
MAAAVVSTKLSFQQSGAVQVLAAPINLHRFSVSFSSPSLYSQPASRATKGRKASPVLASIFPFTKNKDKKTVKQELLEAIAPLDRGADASPDDQARVDMIAQNLEKLSSVKDTVTSTLINGKWELLYTTSETILKKQRPKLLRPRGPIYQAINNDSLRAQNLETWPFFNQVTANLTPLSGRKMAVKFDAFKIGGLISIQAPERARGELEITYLDEELRVSRGDKGDLFVLKMVDPTYRVPT